MFNDMNIIYGCDYYKVSHKAMLPEGLEYQYNNFVARSNKYLSGYDKVVVFGVERAWNKIVDKFNKDLFDKTKKEAMGIIDEYKNFVQDTLGIENYDVSHWIYLYELGYLPCKCRAIKEGEEAPMGTPFFTIENTNPKFVWLIGWLETIISAEMWKSMTVATVIKKGYYEPCVLYADKTCDNNLHVPFQCHDFSVRGQANMEDAINNGLAHLQYFDGTDNVPAMKASGKKHIASIPATEHSIMCSYEQDNELDLFRHLMHKVYPTDLLSIVSDTWDYWNIFNEYLPILKEEIIARDGRVVIRPDSGNPVDIICGDSNAATEYEKKGSIELLWDIFGGTINSKGYKVLNPHIGLIYGDGITPEILQETFIRLEAKGFASSNIVFGVGSYSLSSMYSRDSFGMAIKATHIVVNGEERLIYKNPKTSKENIKKSLKGRAVVLKDEFGCLKTIDSLNLSQEKEFEEKNQLKVFYCR